MKAIGHSRRQATGRWLNNRAESSHLPFCLRERAMLRFRRLLFLLKFVTIHASVRNHFNQERHLYSQKKLNSIVPPLLPSGGGFVPDRFTRSAVNRDRVEFI
jgi:putative transposase